VAPGHCARVKWRTRAESSYGKRRVTQMTKDYKVVPLRKLMTWPSDFTSYPKYDDEFVAQMEDALIRQSYEGWELVTMYAFHQHSGPGYAIFRRAEPYERKSQES
jgi:hypothetical protein